VLEWFSQIHCQGLCTIQLLLIESYYILVINLSVSICCILSSEINQTVKLNLTMILKSLSNKLTASKSVVLTTNTHTYQSFKFLKSSAKIITNLFGEGRIIQSF
jgi:hypothetical protein